MIRRVKQAGIVAAMVALLAGPGLLAQTVPNGPEHFRAIPDTQRPLPSPAGGVSGVSGGGHRQATTRLLPGHHTRSPPTSRLCGFRMISVRSRLQFPPAVSRPHTGQAVRASRVPFTPPECLF
jgi:hypothetical protein